VIMTTGASFLLYGVIIVTIIYSKRNRQSAVKIEKV